LTLGHGRHAQVGAGLLQLPGKLAEPLRADFLAGEHGDGVGTEPADAEPILSDKDAAAPTFAEASASGLLPGYRACATYTAGLRLTWDNPIISDVAPGSGETQPKKTVR
jgi:hypothetical protein